MDIFPNVSKASSKTAGFRHGCLAGMWNNPKLYEIFFVSYHTFGFLRSSPRGTLLGCVATVGSHDPTFIDNLAAAISTFQLNKFGQLHALSLHSCWEPLKWIKNETSSMWNGLSRQWLCRLECKSTNQKQPCRSEPITIPSSKCGMPKFISGLINQTNLYHVYYVKMVAPEGKYSRPPPLKKSKKTFYKSATGWICLLFWSLSRTWYFNDISLELQVSRGFTFRVVSIHACQSSPKTMVWNHGQIKLAKKCSRFILNNRITKQHVETSLNPQPLPTPTTLHEKSASKSYLSINWRVGVPTPPPSAIWFSPRMPTSPPPWPVIGAPNAWNLGSEETAPDG